MKGAYDAFTSNRCPRRGPDVLGACSGLALGWDSWDLTTHRSVAGLGRGTEPPLLALGSFYSALPLNHNRY